jgi:dTDP-4-dehydrorhamnose reductase
MAREPVRLMLTGANGQLGFELVRSLAVIGDVWALDRTACDLADPASVEAAVSRWRPHIIVNAAAWTAVDKAESEPEAASAVNAAAPGLLASLAADSGALLVHYSTDYVFDGSGIRPWREGDATGPLSVYGQSKLAGERAIVAAGARHLIFRTSWVYGAHGANFLKTVLRLARERDRLAMVADQIGAPTGAALIADVTAQVLAQYLRSRREQFAYGTYHLAAAGETSWQQYARFVVAEAGALGQSFALSADDIAPIAAKDYPLPARRPANSRLDCSKLCETFGLHLPDWRDGVRQLLRLLC